jgi:hypothetical protein
MFIKTIIKLNLHEGFMDIKQEIKVLLVRNNLSMRKLVNLLNEKYNRTDTVQNLSKKLTRNTIRFNEVQEIINILGYNVEFTPQGIIKNGIIPSRRNF